MSTSTPPSDTPATVPTVPTVPPVADAVPTLVRRVLRRWPWLVVGLAVGLGLGFLYYTLRPAVYQSTAQLLLVKNRSEPASASSGGDARSRPGEDELATQVVLLGSERVLEPAARRLGEYQLSAVPPPANAAGFLKARFAVAREKEPGVNTPSNILRLTFDAPNPADAPKYLRAIIDAYRAEVASLSGSTSPAQLQSVQNEIQSLEAARAKEEADRRALDRQLHGGTDEAGHAVAGVSQEDLAGIRSRLTTNHTTADRLNLRLIVIESEEADIAAVGPTRADRLALLARLAPADRPAEPAGPNDPNALLASLLRQQAALSARYGPGHTQMVALRNQIEAVKADVKGHGGDELGQYARRLVSEKAAIKKQLEWLGKAIRTDEEKAQKMADLEDRIAARRANIAALDARLRDKQLEVTRLHDTQPLGGVEVRDVTQPAAGVRVAPSLVLSLALGAIAGLLLGIGLGLTAESFGRGARSPSDVQTRLGLTVLGRIPRLRTTAPVEIAGASLDSSQSVSLHARSAESDAARAVLARVLSTLQDRDHQIIQLTSPNPGDGTSTLAANLAAALAVSGKRVVLVDCNFRNPQLHRVFGLPDPELGLASVVTDQADLGAAVQPCDLDNLTLLPGGPRTENPAELLANPRFQNVLDTLRTTYDFVVLDTPPVLAGPDPVTIAPRADGVILVFRMNRRAQPTVEQARTQLTTAGGKLLGAIVNTPGR